MSRSAFVAAVVAVVATSTAATAQHVMLSAWPAGGGSSVVYDLSDGSERFFSNDFITPTFATADGTVLIHGATGSWRARVIATGVDLSLPVGFEPWVAAPIAPQIYGVIDRTTVARIDASGLTRWPVCGADVTALDLSLDGRDLFVLCRSSQVIVLDAGTGAERRRFVLGPADEFSGLWLDAAGTSFVTLHLPGGATFRRFDAISGELLSQSPPVPSPVRFVRNRTRDALAGLHCLGVRVTVTCWLRVMPLGTLAAGPDLGVWNTLPGVAFSVDGADLYINLGDRVARLDAATGAVLNAAAPTGGRIFAWPVPTPFAPESLSAAVTGRTVQLTWSLPATSPLATGYRIDVGSAAGLRDLASITVGAERQLAVSDVPSGRYFVTVRGSNGLGDGTRSAEVVVDVPSPDR